MSELALDLSQQAQDAAEALEAYIATQENTDLLRFITCGSVDDGKSTLIGRMLYDSKKLFDDQLSALEADSKKVGTTGGKIDLALLVDGLAAEREQGITIDVAYRFFATDKRKFIVADTPGHEQYTRNMATGASTADLAVILIDARQGVLTQTRRHSFLASLLGIKHVILAVNKMDLVDFDQGTFDSIVAEYTAFAADLGLTDIQAIPLSALDGDNVLMPSTRCDWYTGPTLMQHLETVDVRADAVADFRFPVQWVNRPNLDFRGFSGTVSGASVSVGDKISVHPSGVSSTVARIVTMDGDLETAYPGQAVTLTLKDEIDVSRGDVIAKAELAPHVADQIAVDLIWMDEDAMLPERKYLLKLGTHTVSASVTDLTYKVNVNTLEHLAAKKLALNEVARCHVSLDQALVFDPYDVNKDMGAFIIIDRFTNKTVGAGLVRYALRRASNISWQDFDVTRESRAKMKEQKPVVLWFTGLSGSGKSTIASLVEKKLHAYGKHTFVLDGDNVRHGLCRDLGFSVEDRVENIRRVSNVAKLMTDAGLIVLTTLISPFRAERTMAREMFEENDFLEIFIDTPLDVAEQRDPKGLYAKARAGEISNFTGISSPYEAPEAPELVIKTEEMDAEAAADQIITFLMDTGRIWRRGESWL